MNSQVAVEIADLDRRARWTDGERYILAKPPRAPICEWIEQNRYLDDTLSGEPGLYHLDRTPYFREIFECQTDPDVEEVTIVKCVQSGATEFALTLLAYIIDQDPGGCLYVMPTRDDANFAADRIRSMIHKSPAVVRHATGKLQDLKGQNWKFDRMRLRLGWAGSDASLASFPAPYVMLDELAKSAYAPPAKADRVALARARTQTFRLRRKIWKWSTPEHEGDLLMREFERGDRRTYHVPCPHCGTHAPLVFHPDSKGHRFTWAKDATIEQIAKLDLAWFTCVECNERIEPRHKTRIVARGVWCPADAHVDKTGTVIGGETTRFRSYQYWAAISPWVKWGEIASGWLIAQSSVEELRSFLNNVLAEPFTEKASDVTLELVKSRQLPGHFENYIPQQALFVTTGIDVQKGYYRFATRAWGYGERSWLVRKGTVYTEEQLEAEVVRAGYYRAHDESGERIGNRLVLMDARYEQEAVYAFCRKFGEFVKPTMGTDRLASGAPYKQTPIEKDARGKPMISGPQLVVFSNLLLKSKLARHMQADVDSVGAWFLHESVGDEYLLEVTSEHKVTERRGALIAERWMLKRGRTNNHWWDCEVLNVLAEMLLGLPWLAYDPKDVDRADAEPDDDHDEGTPGAKRRFAAGGWRRRSRR